jgi:hypothetical protein
MRTPNVFTDPNTGNTYSWPTNHNEEGDIGKSRQMADGAPTSNIGLIPQQGAATPLILTWKGTILKRAQLVAMISWYQLCETQSVYVSDAAGNQYEVLITDFTAQRQRAALNPQDLASAPFWYWTYSLTMRVLRVLAGEWAGVVS